MIQDKKVILTVYKNTSSLCLISSTKGLAFTGIVANTVTFGCLNKSLTVCTKL